MGEEKMSDNDCP